ncbi:MAG: LuxR family transcriptional regulator, partial [Cyanobacteria bacterium RYN_339]|nr:LuxR family transcriptional regulator [Cyanobacteria bacterium RYN_339]
MSETWIDRGKITPPRAPDDWLRRTWSPRAQALLLSAPPGYGKTSALLALADQAREAGHLVAWYTADVDDVDPVSFFRYLATALQAQIPAFGQELLGALAGGKLDERALWGRFFEAVLAYNVPGLFVAIDDAHYLAATQLPVLKGLLAHAGKLPPGFRVALGLRGELPLPLGKLVAGGAAEVWGPAALRFSPAEEQAFLAARAGGVVPAGWTRRAADMEGWPLGLDLATSVLADVALDPLGGPVDAVAAYLAEEVFASLPAAAQETLLGAALLEAPTAAACEQVFGRPDAAAQLAALARAHLLQPLADGLRYRLPAYLRTFLVAELERRTPAATRLTWHQAAAAYHRGRGEAELALPHLIQAGDFAAAAGYAMQAFPPLLARGRTREMARWLATFPPAFAQADPSLTYWRAELANRAGQAAEAAQGFERARASFHAADDPAGELKATVRLATIAMYARDLRRSGALQLKALGMLDGARPEDQADLQLTRAVAAEQRGDIPLTRECNEAVLTIPIGDNIEVAVCHTFAHANLYTLALQRGELAAAEEHVRRGAELARAWGFQPTHLLMGFLHAHLELIEGAVEAAGAFLRALPAHWEDQLDWHDLGVAWTVAGRYHQVKGEAREAERALERARAVFRAADFPEGEKLPLERMLWLAVQRSQARRLEELATAIPAEPTSVYDLALVLPLARGRQLAGEPARAVAQLMDALPLLDALEAWPLRA